MLVQPVPEGLHPVEGTHSAAIQEVQSVGRDNFVEDYLPWEGSFARPGKDVRRKNGQRQCGDPTTCILHPPVPLREGGREFGNRVEPMKKKEVGEDVFKIWFYFSLSYSDFKLN